MHGWIRSVPCVLAALSLVSCSSRVARNPYAGLVHPDVLAKVGLQHYWTPLQVTLNPKETVRILYRLDENLYVLTSENRVIVIDAARPIIKWSAVIAGRNQTVFPPCHADYVTLSEKPSGMKEILSPEKMETGPAFSAVMFNTLSDVLVFDRLDGRLVRKIPFQFAANSGGASDGVYFYVGAINGLYHALYLQEAVPAWTLSTDGVIKAPLQYFDGRLYVASDDHTIRAVETGRHPKLLWSKSTYGPLVAPFYVDIRGCFVPSDDGRIYALDLAIGSPLWPPFICQGPLRDAIQVSAKTIFQYASRDRFYAVELTTGRQRWSMPQGRTVLAVMDGQVYLLDQFQNLVIVDELLGTVKGTVPLTGLDVLLPNITASAIYGATADGRIACIRPVSAGYLVPEMIKPITSQPATPPPPVTSQPTTTQPGLKELPPPPPRPEPPPGERPAPPPPKPTPTPKPTPPPKPPGRPLPGAPGMPGMPPILPMGG